MNTRFRTAQVAVLAALFLINPGLLPHGSDLPAHASEPAPPARISVISNAPADTSVVYAVQAAACREESNARIIQLRLQEKGYTPVLHAWKDPSGTFWHSVFLGVYDDAVKARRMADRYKEAESRAPFIKTLDGRVLKTSPAKSMGPERNGSPPSVREERTLARDQGVRSETVESAEDEATPLEFSCSGFIEFESFINTGTGQSLKDKNEKNEIRNRLQLKYGTEGLFLFSVSNVYLFQTYLNKRADDHYRYARHQQVSRNLRLSSQEAEISFDELYLNYSGERFRLRAGNQIYGWGTADAFNPTSYFNPSDMREMLFRDDDENRAGVPSLSGMFFLGDYTLEAVFVPVHIPPIMAPEGNFWALAIDSFFLPVVTDDPERLGVDIDHVAYGVRLSTSRGGVDISVSGYRGPDRNQIFLPFRIVRRGSTPVSLELRPQSSVVTMLGFDLSAALGDFVVQLEAAYSPDKAGIVEQRIATLADLNLPFETDRAHYISYAAGFNYFIPLNRLIEGHTGDTVLTVEWFQGRYLEGGLYTSPITDIASCKLEDSYFDGRVRVTIKGIFETRHGGKVFWPEIGYDFQNGFLVEAGYAAIRGDRGSSWESDSIFYYFKDNDVLMAKVRYRY